MNRIAILATAGAATALAAIGIPIATAAAGPSTSTTSTASAAGTSPAAASATASATTANPTPAPSVSNRTFPYTPSVLPYGLSLTSSHVEGIAGNDIVWIYNTSAAGIPTASLQLTVVTNPGTALDVLHKDGTTSAPAATGVTVNGLDAKYVAGSTWSEGGNTIDRSHEGSLLFQASAGHWLLISGHDETSVAATSDELIRVASGLSATPLANLVPSTP